MSDGDNQERTSIEFIDPETGRELNLTPLQRAFLSAFAVSGVVATASKSAGCSPQRHYVAMRTNEDYRLAYDLVYKQACDALEAEARRRALEGWDEPVFQQGMKVGVKRKYSDVLMIFLMKGAMPDKYADRVKSEVSNNSNITVYQLPDNGRDK